MSTSIRDRAIKLLGQNIQQSLVASALGVTESYISQLLLEEGVASEVAHLKAAKLEGAVAQDETISSIKKDALRKIQSTLQYARSPLEAARVFQILDQAKSITDSSAGDQAGIQTVTITLPAAARNSVQITLNSSNQVIDVEGRSMAPLPSRALPALAKRLAAPEDVEVLPVKLPATPTAKTDTEVAANKLHNLKDITFMMDGVALVL